jgi:hypothetical protein
MPVDGRIQVTVIRYVDDDRPALRNLHGRARDGSVIGQHAHGRVADLLLDRQDLELELAAVGELEQFRLPRVREPFGRGWQVVELVRVVFVHTSSLPGSAVGKRRHANIISSLPDEGSRSGNRVIRKL